MLIGLIIYVLGMFASVALIYKMKARESDNMIGIIIVIYMSWIGCIFLIRRIRNEKNNVK